jgi:MtN3 and saliva related transmembrane protein
MDEIIGYMAASLTTLSFLPQAIKVIKTRDTKSISLIMYILFSIGVALWLLYGILLHNLPILIANAVTLALALVILYFKLSERND